MQIDVYENVIGIADAASLEKGRSHLPSMDVSDADAAMRCPSAVTDAALALLCRPFDLAADFVGTSRNPSPLAAALRQKFIAIRSWKTPSCAWREVGSRQALERRQEE